ncbi:unnamed protein product, partial [Arabidopsis halleri]
LPETRLLLLLLLLSCYLEEKRSSRAFAGARKTLIRSLRRSYSPDLSPESSRVSSCDHCLRGKTHGFDFSLSH